MNSEENKGERGTHNVPSLHVKGESLLSYEGNDEVQCNSETGSNVVCYNSCEGTNKKDSYTSESVVKSRCSGELAEGIAMDQTVQNGTDNSPVCSTHFPAEGESLMSASEALEGQNMNDRKVIYNTCLPTQEIYSTYFSEAYIANVRLDGGNGISEQDRIIESVDASADCFMVSSPASSNQTEGANSDLIYEREHHSQPEAEILSNQHVWATQSEPHEVSNFRSGRAFFFYELPLPEETGPWIPVSVPPMEAQDFEKGLDDEGVYCGGYFPEFGAWPEGYDQENKDVDFRTTLFRVLETLLGKGKAMVETIELVWNPSHAPMKLCNKSSLIKKVPMRIEEVDRFCSPFFACDVGQDVQMLKEVLETDPPQWLPDSAASSCMLCGSTFRPFTCARHHCRFCGGIFCNECSNGRCLLPSRFRERDPQRVCDPCWFRLEPTQKVLADQVSNAAQIAIRDVTDFSCLRAWLNNPFGMSMEQEIFKATNTLRSYYKVGMLAPEKSIPKAVLKGAKGVAIITVAKVGMMMTYKLGTGLVVARRIDGTWSAPSAIASCGVGWGLQAGGELTDFIIVLRTTEAVRAFAGCLHVSVGASLSAAAGPIGRAAEADIRAGDGGAAACYTYSTSKGAFIGCSLESNVVATRSATNTRFYGDSCITTADILLGPLPRPKAASPLYTALSDLFSKAESCSTL